MQAPLYPVSLDIFQASVEFREFRAGDALSCGAVGLRTAPLNHPNGATGYRIDYPRQVDLLHHRHRASRRPASTRHDRRACAAAPT